MQTRGQHAACTTVVVSAPTVLVDVTLHWKLWSLHGEPQVDPMGQHAGLLASSGSTMQLWPVSLHSWDK